MDKNSIIDKETFEVCTHAEDHPNVFVCDKMIAPAVALLNKKGYRTFASCSGHYRIEFYEYLNENIDKLKEYQKNERFIIKNVRENTFDYWREVDSTGIYILFRDKYDFDNLPNDFILEENYGLDYPRTYIGCDISYYDKNNKHRQIQDVYKEIEDKCKKLYEWVENLPINN